MAQSYCYFWSHLPDKYPRHKERAAFSQWYPSQFVDVEMGREFANAEQYMMARKAILFNDQNTLAEILACKNPKQVKGLGRAVQNFDEVVWQQHRYEIVLRACILKFGSGPELRKILLDTGDAILVEASPFDSIWGIGLDQATAEATPANRWPGLNLLGRALTEAREHLKAAPAPAAAVNA